MSERFLRELFKSLWLMGGIMRGLDQEFINDLLIGDLKPIWYSIKSDQRFRLEIRGNYVNIYYRGGNALRISKILTMQLHVI